MTRRPGRLAAGLVLLGLGLALNSLLGPVGAEVVDFRITETLRNQMLGLDAVSLAFVAPLALVAAALVARGHAAGPALAVGIGAYTAYMMLQYVLGPDYAGIAGNSERLFPLYLALFTVGWAVALVAWTAADGERLLPGRRQARVLGAVVLPLLALVTFSRYLPQLADILGGAPEDEGYLAGPAFFWTIALMDLGILLPVTAAAAWGLVTGRSWAGKALFLTVVWLALVGAAVAGMAVAMYVNDDPIATGGGTVFMTVLGSAYVVLALAIARPLFGGGSRDAAFPHGSSGGAPMAPRRPATTID